MKTFVIHLERATARRAQVDHILKLTPDAEILPACDGAALSGDARSDIYSRNRFKPNYPFALSVGEIGCFESHKSAWKCIVEQNLDWGLIIEDDVQVDSLNFNAALELAQLHVNDRGYTQFQVRNIKGACREVVRKGGFALVRPDLVPLRTSAQLVSRAAAEKLLALSDKIDRPVDAFLQMRWLTGVDITCVIPSGVSDRTAETGGSTLSKKRSIWDELKVSMPRLVYRRQIKRLSARS
ncbi:glycosyltransferase family 25 protein [Litoreibacter sp.]|nr:glycosyltransferase family 25 protein [Litoreibacter sp.]